MPKKNVPRIYLTWWDHPFPGYQGAPLHYNSTAPSTPLTQWLLVLPDGFLSCNPVLQVSGIDPRCLLFPYRGRVRHPFDFSSLLPENPTPIYPSILLRTLTIFKPTTILQFNAPFAAIEDSPTIGPNTDFEMSVSLINTQLFKCIPINSSFAYSVISRCLCSLDYFILTFSVYVKRQLFPICFG